MLLKSKNISYFRDITAIDYSIPNIKRIILFSTFSVSKK